MQWIDAIQGGLDVASFVPGLNVPASLLNSGISLARGDYADAALSAIGVVPGGEALGMLGKFAKGARTAEKIGEDAGAVTHMAEDVTKLHPSEAALPKTDEVAPPSSVSAPKDPSGHSGGNAPVRTDKKPYAASQPDYITTPNGTSVKMGDDYNSINPNNKNDWQQIHTSHDHDGVQPHTHYPEQQIHNGQVKSVTRETKPTDAGDIDKADANRKNNTWVPGKTGGRGSGQNKPNTQPTAPKTPGAESQIPPASTTPPASETPQTTGSTPPPAPAPDVDSAPPAPSGDSDDAGS